jgi:hypothetical protein
LHSLNSLVRRRMRRGKKWRWMRVRRRGREC